MEEREAIWEFIMITFVAVIVAAAVFFFLIPSHVSVGSVSGLAIVLGSFVPLKVSTVTPVLNILLPILGFLFIGKEFGSEIVYTSFLLPVVLTVFELMFPDNQSVTNNAFLDMLYYIFMASIDLAMLFDWNASPGELDIVAEFLNKYLHMELDRATSLAGMCVTLSSVLVCDKKIVVLGVLGTYLNGIALDHLIFGSNIRKRVYIVSEHEEEIKEFILYHLHGDATIYGTIGAYDKKPRREIITIVDKSEYSMLMIFALRTDKDAFVTVYTINEITYRSKC